MVLKATPLARLGWLLILPALLLAAACGGGDGGSAEDGDESTPLPGIQTYYSDRTLARGTVDAQTPDVTPEGTASLADPEAAVGAVIEQVLLTQVEEEDIEVVSATAGEWSDSCLGIVYAGEDIVCEQVVTPGFQVVVRFGDTTMTWRATEDGSVVRFVTQEIN